MSPTPEGPPGGERNPQLRGQIPPGWKGEPRAGGVKGWRGDPLYWGGGREGTRHPQSLDTPLRPKP